MKWELLLSVLCFASIASATPDPVGQKAHYKVDLDPARTSQFIKSGTIDIAVTKYVAAAEGNAYQTQIDYKYQVKFVGTKSGTEETLVDEAYFDPKFIEELRKNGTYAGPNFKAKHLGYADAKNMDGKLYPHCDKIYLYDFKKDEAFALLAAELLSKDDRAKIENLTAVVHLHPGIPVLGGAKIDVAGTYDGIAVKAGGDYLP